MSLCQASTELTSQVVSTTAPDHKGAYMSHALEVVGWLRASLRPWPRPLSLLMFGRKEEERIATSKVWSQQGLRPYKHCPDPLDTQPNHPVCSQWLLRTEDRTGAAPGVTGIGLCTFLCISKIPYKKNSQTSLEKLGHGS